MHLNILDLHDQNILEKQNREDAYIASLDPLHADESMQLVPTLNREKDTIALVLMLVDILPYMSTATSFDFYQANAAMRDIGILLGSLKRHRVEPVNVIPQLEEKLNVLANATNLPPRDTLIHYTAWNPNDERVRSYTGTLDELYLIDSVRIAMNPLINAIYYLKDLYHTPVDSPSFASLGEHVIANFSKMVDGIVQAKRNVSPQYFAQELRFYFDPVILNEREYLGPGAVEMPVFVFDHILWGADCNEAVYREFQNTYVPYIQAHVREIFADFEGQESLVSKVVNYSRNINNPISSNYVNSCKVLIKMFNMMKSFRMPHKKLADEAYKHSGGGQREKGSGGYEPQILDYILKLTLQNSSRIEESLNRLHSYR